MVALLLLLAGPVGAWAQSAATPAVQVAAQNDPAATAAPDAAGTTLQVAPEGATPPATQTPDLAPVDNHPWWFWPTALLFFCFILGIIAVMAGVGGGVLFVPLVSGFFPFHLDFVRGAGLLVALAGAVCCGVTSPTCVWPCPWRSLPQPAPLWAPCWVWLCPPM